MKKSKAIFMIVLSAICISITIVVTCFICNGIGMLTAPEEYVKEALSNSDKEYENYILTSGVYQQMTPEELESRADIIAVCEYTGETNTVLTDEEYTSYVLSPVSTDYVFSVANVIKGEPGETVNVRFECGEFGDTCYVDPDMPIFETGKQYCIYLRKAAKAFEGDVDSYWVVLGSHSCFEVEASGELDTDVLSLEDAQKIQEMYDTAVDNAVTE